MLKYKIDVLDALRMAGYSTYKMRKEKLLGESAIQKLRKGEMVGTDSITKICTMLNAAPGDIVENSPSVAATVPSSVGAYNQDNLREMGYVYKSILYVMNKKGNDPYPMSDIFPFKYLTMVYIRAVPLGIPDSINKRIADLMEDLDPDDVGAMMEVPVPMNMRMNWQYGIMQCVKEKNE